MLRQSLQDAKLTLGKPRDGGMGGMARPELASQLGFRTENWLFIGLFWDKSGW